LVAVAPLKLPTAPELEPAVPVEPEGKDDRALESVSNELRALSPAYVTLSAR
jgi:hypothetical protein